MNPIDVIIVAVIVLILALATAYIIKAKKSGRKCIGCPDSGNCPGHCSGNCSGCSGNCGGHSIQK